MARVKKLKINDSTYDIKDALSRKATDATRTSDTLSTEDTTLLGNIQSDLRTAVADNTVTDVIGALTALKNRITTPGAGQLNIQVNGVALAPASGGHFNANKADASTYNIPVPIHASNPTSASDETGYTTPKDVADQITSAITGAAAFQGLIESNIAWPPVTGFKKGQYWVVKDADTYYQKYLEQGDQVFAIKDDDSSRTSSNIWTYFNVVQANLNLSDYAELDGGSDALHPQTFTGQHLFDANSSVAFTGYVYAPTVGTADNSQSVATTEFVRNVIAATDTDKVKDYEYIAVDLSTTSTYGEVTLGTNIYTNIGTAYTNKKIPVVKLTLSWITGDCPIVMTKYQATATEYHGSAYITEANQKILVGIYSSSTSTKVTLTKAVTAVNTTTVDAVDAEYISADEAIKFTTVAPVASVTLS